MCTGKGHESFTRVPLAPEVTRRESLLAQPNVDKGKVLRYFSRKSDFPFITVRWGDPVPSRSLLVRKRHEMSIASDIDDADPALWFDVSRGNRAPTLYEQVYLQQQGYALILLSIEPAEEDEDDDGTKAYQCVTWPATDQEISQSFQLASR
jgi:hypothetical protein